MSLFRNAACTNKIGEQKQYQTLSYAVTAVCGWRTFMEDTHLAKFDIGDGCSIFGVFDGHGGSEVAKFTAQHFIEILISTTAFVDQRYSNALIETYSIIDRKMKSPEGIKQLNQIKVLQNKQVIPKQQWDQQQDVGCTAVVCLITKNQIFVANAGDSRCIVSIGQNCESLSFDHRPQNPQQKIRIKNAGGYVVQDRVNGNLNISRALGDFTYKSNLKIQEDQQIIISKPDLISRPLDEVNFIILGSDGIFQKKSNQQIANMIKEKSKNKSLETVGLQVVNSLIAPSAQYFSGKDNMTLIVVKMNKD